MLNDPQFPPDLCDMIQSESKDFWITSASATDAMVPPSCNKEKENVQGKQGNQDPWEYVVVEVKSISEPMKAGAMLMRLRNREVR